MAGNENDIREVEDVEASTGLFTELGVTGLKRSGGYLDEEFLPQLRGKKAVQVYREIRDNDDIVGALMFAIIQLCRNVEWSVTPAGKSTDDANATKLVETCMEDMSHSWDDMIAEIVDGKLTYGWQWNETVYKRRMGPWEKDPRKRSQFTDGLVGWRKMPGRAQETLQRWAFDENGDVRAMIQLGAPDYTQRIIPIEKSSLFRYGTTKNSPEGRSMLRNIYRPWFYKKRLEEFESIGVERDLAGLPKIGVPASYLSAKPGTPQAKQVEAMKKMVRGIRRNEQEGIVFPLAYDPETKQPLFSFDLVGSGGARQFQTDTLIQRYQTSILMTVLADFIKVGHESSGTYNMHVDKTGIFKTALNSILKNIADVLNRHAVPRLFEKNGWKPAQLPKIVPGDVDAPDIAQLAAFLAQTAGLGFQWQDADMEKFLRTAAGLPALAESDFKQRRVVARKEEATRFAETQTAYLAARSTLAQQMAASQMQTAGEPSAADTQEAMGVAQTAQGLAQGDANEQRTQEQHDTAQSAAQDTAAGAQLGHAQQMGEILNPDQGKDKPKPKSPAAKPKGRPVSRSKK